MSMAARFHVQVKSVRENTNYLMLIEYEGRDAKDKTQSMIKLIIISNFRKIVPQLCALYHTLINTCLNDEIAN